MNELLIEDFVFQEEIPVTLSAVSNLTDGNILILAEDVVTNFLVKNLDEKDLDLFQVV